MGNRAAGVSAKTSRVLYVFGHTVLQVHVGGGGGWTADLVKLLSPPYVRAAQQYQIWQSPEFTSLQVCICPLTTDNQVAFSPPFATKTKHCLGKMKWRT
jgi:hypothetical protein